MIMLIEFTYRVEENRLNARLVDHYNIIVFLSTIRAKWLQNAQRRN